MKHRKFVLHVVAGLVACAVAGAAWADDYPTRPIRVITNTSAGGLSDIFARAVGEEIRKDWGQPLIVDNRPGGSQNVGTRVCSDSTGDGYTICILNADSIVYNQFLFKQIPFDPENGIVPVTNLYHLIQTLVVNASLGVKTVDELVALSKSKPDALALLLDLGDRLFQPALFGVEIDQAAERQADGRLADDDLRARPWALRRPARSPRRAPAA